MRGGHAAPVASHGGSRYGRGSSMPAQELPPICPACDSRQRNGPFPTPRPGSTTVHSTPNRWICAQIMAHMTPLLAIHSRRLASRGRTLIATSRNKRSPGATRTLPPFWAISTTTYGPELAAQNWVFCVAAEQSRLGTELARLRHFGGHRPPAEHHQAPRSSDDAGGPIFARGLAAASPGLAGTRGSEPIATSTARRAAAPDPRRGGHPSKPFRIGRECSQRQVLPRFGEMFLTLRDHLG
jgi:hypothetical protein